MFNYTNAIIKIDGVSNVEIDKDLKLIEMPPLFGGYKKVEKVDIDLGRGSYYNSYGGWETLDVDLKFRLFNASNPKLDNIKKWIYGQNEEIYVHKFSFGVNSDRYYTGVYSSFLDIKFYNIGIDDIIDITITVSLNPKAYLLIEDEWILDNTGVYNTGNTNSYPIIKIEIPNTDDEIRFSLGGVYWKFNNKHASNTIYLDLENLLIYNHLGKNMYRYVDYTDYSAVTTVGELGKMIIKPGQNPIGAYLTDGSSPHNIGNIYTLNRSRFL